MHRATFDVWIYFETLRNLLQTFLSSISGTFDFDFAPAAFARPAMLVYGGWLALGLLYSLRKRFTFLFLFLVFPIILLPFVNQNYTVPDKSRYLSFLLPICYLAMALVMVAAARRFDGSASRRIWRSWTAQCP